MSALDTLSILIEADSAGLTTQLKKAGNTIQRFVSDMNKQEVNWESILSKTISPAIISGIAATFALALAQSLSFTDSLTTSANSSSTAFQTNMNAAGQSALDLQSSTGQSASSIISAMAQATQALGSYAAGNEEVSEASKFALATGTDLKTLVSTLTPVLAEWGVSADKVSDTIKNLFGTAAQGKVDVGGLSDLLADYGSRFKNASVSIDDVTASIEALSNQSGVTGPTAIETVKHIGDAIGDIRERALLSTIGVQNLFGTLKTQGVEGVIAQIATYFSSVSDSTAQILGQHAGFTPETIEQLRNAGITFTDISTSTQTIVDNAGALGTKIEGNLGPVQRLQIAWGAIKSDLTEIIGLPFDGWLASWLTSVDAGLKAFDELKDSTSDFSKTQVGSAVGGLADKVHAFFSAVPALKGGLAASISGNANSVTQGSKDTTQTPSGTTNIYNSDHSVNVSVSSNSIGGTKGANSQSMSSALYAGQFGY